MTESLTFRGRTVTVSAANRVMAGGDGELLEELPITAEVAHGALHVLLA